jgi:hypothetical protein
MRYRRQSSGKQRLTRKPPPPQPRWNILYVGKKAKLLLGDVKAPDAHAAIAKAAEWLRVPAAKLIAVRRG